MHLILTRSLFVIRTRLGPQGMATAVTVASTDRKLVTDLMALFTSSSFRALYTPDVMGVEVGGAVKNVIAIAAGMSEGLGLGTNAMAALVTRGCGEMRRLVTTLGGESSTVRAIRCSTSACILIFIPI